MDNCMDSPFPAMDAIAFDPVRYGFVIPGEGFLDCDELRAQGRLDAVQAAWLNGKAVAPQRGNGEGIRTEVHMMSESDPSRTVCGIPVTFSPPTDPAVLTMYQPSPDKRVCEACAQPRLGTLLCGRT